MNPMNLGGHRLYRRVFIMEKSGILGKIANYELLDFIVVDLTVDEPMPLIRPIPDVMMQRFLLPGHEKIIKKSFWFGLKG